MRDGEGLPKGWSWATVEELGAVSEQPVLTGPFGASLGRDDFLADGVPVLTIGCLTDAGLSLEKAMYISRGKAEELARYCVKTGDLLFSRMASVGRSDIVTSAFDGAVINYHLMRLRLATQIIDPRYFVYFVRGAASVQDYVRQVNHGATRDGINTQQLMGMPVLIAPFAEQRRIVEAIEQQFTRLDAGVAALKRAQAALKRYRAAVLKAAVEGKLTATWRAEHPNLESASDLLQRILAERRAKWEADVRAKGKDPAKTRYVAPEAPDIANLPELPAGWLWLPLRETGYWAGGGTPSKSNDSYWQNGTVPWVSPKDMKRFIITGTQDRITETAVDESTVTLCPVGSVLVVVRSGILQRTLPVAVTQVPVTLNQDMKGISPWAGVNSMFLAFALMAFEHDILDRCSKDGTTVASIETESLMSYCVPLPPLAEQEQIVAEVEQRLSIVNELEATLEATLKRADRLRQSILERAFAGKLVPQRHDDEPASVLLERIRERRGNSHSRLPNKRNAVQESDIHQSSSDDTGTAKVTQTRLW